MAVAAVHPKPMPTEDREALLAHASMLQAEVRRRQYLAHPDGIAHWIEGELGESLWSKQREIVRLVQTQRRVAVPSCYASGKSWLAARVGAFWITTHPPGQARLITTATTGAQVKAILWTELATAHARGSLPGRLNQTEWYLPVPIQGKDGSVTIKEELVGFGRKPADMDSAAFQGIHQRYVLVIVDEAAGVPDTLLDQAEGLIANEDSRILLIGNPDETGGLFARACEPGSGWNVLRIPAWVTPNFTGEPVPEVIHRNLVSKLWVEEKRRTPGEGSTFWKTKIEAEFPETRADGLIPIKWIREAQERTLAKGWPVELGVDVGGGGDKNVVCCRWGAYARIVRRNTESNTMVSCGNVISDLHACKAQSAKIDWIGMGRGMTERGQELGYPFVGINVGERPTSTPSLKNADESFVNLRAEYYWGLRLRFQDASIDLDPDDHDLAAQLRELRFKRNSRGQIVMESKLEMAARGVHSPDDADALMLAFATPRDVGPTAAVVMPGSTTASGAHPQEWRKDYFRR